MDLQADLHQTPIREEDVDELPGWWHLINEMHLTIHPKMGLNGEAF